jgi:arylsulfatase A-like enzyme
MRTFSLSLICSLVFLSTSTTLRGEENASPMRPNIVWFIVDDMSANFSCYGESTIRTPHVDQLAAEGTRFTRAFVTAPVCSPCRSALITGMYQTSIGSHHHRSGRGQLKINLPNPIVPIPKLLKEAGYFTCIGGGLKGKDARGRATKNGNTPLGKTDYNFEWDPSIYSGSDWSERQPNQPFFMQVQLLGGKLRGGTDAEAVKLSEEAARTFGKAVAPSEVKLPPYYPDHPVLLRDWAAYLDSVRMTDLHVGQVIERLRNEGALENTLIIFMTDHGISHARGKQFLYDEGTHVPLVIRGPNIPQGEKREDLVMHIDIAAITLAAAGLPIPEYMQGVNLFAKNYKPRSAIFAARDRCDETVERIRSVRTDKYLYIRNFYPLRPHLQPNAYKDAKSILIAISEMHQSRTLPELSERLLFATQRPAEELYLWQTDRWQIDNLANSAEHQAPLKQHREILEQWITSTGDKGPESDAMYDSDMTVYVGAGNPVVEQNIAQMKRWQAEGK